MVGCGGRVADLEPTGAVGGVAVGVAGKADLRKVGRAVFDDGGGLDVLEVVVFDRDVIEGVVPGAADGRRRD